VGWADNRKAWVRVTQLFGLYFVYACRAMETAAHYALESLPQHPKTQQCSGIHIIVVVGIGLQVRRPDLGLFFENIHCRPHTTRALVDASSDLGLLGIGATGSQQRHGSTAHMFGSGRARIDHFGDTSVERCIGIVALVKVEWIDQKRQAPVQALGQRAESSMRAEQPHTRVRQNLLLCDPARDVNVTPFAGGGIGQDVIDIDGIVHGPQAREQNAVRGLELLEGLDESLQQRSHKRIRWRAGAAECNDDHWCIGVWQSRATIEPCKHAIGIGFDAWNPDISRQQILSVDQGTDRLRQWRVPTVAQSALPRCLLRCGDAGTVSHVHIRVDTRYRWKASEYLPISADHIGPLLGVAVLFGALLEEWGLCTYNLDDRHDDTASHLYLLHKPQLFGIANADAVMWRHDRSKWQWIGLHKRTIRFEQPSNRAQAVSISKSILDIDMCLESRYAQCTAPMHGPHQWVMYAWVDWWMD
jgi:hypothetical protein